MKQLDPVLVTHDLLNELGTLAAPSMLAVALRTARTELDKDHPATMMLLSYSAEFKEGAREGDSVQICCEEVASKSPEDKAFLVYFSKDKHKLGRIGRWHLIFSEPNTARPLPYSIAQAVADGRTDRDLWRPEPMVATGNTVEDAQALLWLAGQSSRGYLKRLDEDLAASGMALFQDELTARNYGGIFVAYSFLRWPEKGQHLRCALQYQPPINQQSGWDRKMDAHGVSLTEENNDSYLLGTFRFTIVRLNGQRVPIYPDGAMARR